MSTGQGQIVELILEDECRYVRVACPPNLIPGPGQYLLANDGPNSALPLPLFYTDSAAQGFIAVAPVNALWNPGLTLSLRGPLGRGFNVPLAARRVALVAFDDPPARLRGLIWQALKQDAGVVLVVNSMADNLPDAVEVQPLSALDEILEWADYVAFDVAREKLPQLRQQLGNWNSLAVGLGTQILIRTPVPCGGIAECGVCAVTLQSNWKLACKDGPVFDWSDL
jgi:NAD(P)H-flavin reductase